MNKLRKRKNIRLKGYDYSCNGFYFVTICTDFRKPFLGNEKAKAVVVAELARLNSRFKGVNVDYSVIMSNHIHLILHFENSIHSLSEVIQAFKSLTALRAKQALPLQTASNFWQRNYYEHVIRTDKALCKIREYVRNNPLVERIRFEQFYEVGSMNQTPTNKNIEGFTLIEIVIVIVVLGIAMLPLLMMYTNVVVKSTDSQAMRVSSALGQDLMEEILSKRYDENPEEPWTEKQDLGVDGVENPADKTTFDDVDDFVDWAPPGDEYFPGFNNYTAGVGVIYVNPDDLNTDAGVAPTEDTDFKKITVTIRYRGSDKLDIVSVKQGY